MKKTRSKLRKFIRMTLIIISSIVVALIIGVTLFINLSPEFGGKAREKDIVNYKQSGHYEDDIFVNDMETDMSMSFKGYMETLYLFIKGNKNGKPKWEIPVQNLDSLELTQTKKINTEITWFGHSAFILQIDGKTILLDPMLGDVPAPHPWLGGGRYNSELPIIIEKMPSIDAVIISHDHYDHLDYGSIMKLKDKVKHFYMPLGVGAHFREWGIEEERIHELNWWEDINHEGLTLRCTPSRHFSGRGLGDRFKTLWSSWIVKGSHDNIYFSGDSGYGEHFKEIGDKYGPFNLALMECGQYHEKWSNIHMMPEETAQASKDVKAEIMMPIHWGSFSLSLHDWTDPVERVKKATSALNIPMTTPQIGQTILVGNPEEYPTSEWWKQN